MATPDYTFDKSKQTVQGQLDGLMSQDNALMQKAEAKGIQYANKRGLLNSSIGAGAAQSAQLDYAMPIAQADAAANNQFASMKYGADLSKDLAQQQQDFTQSNMNLSNTLQQSNMNLADTIQRGQMDLSQGYQQSNMTLQQQLNEMQAAADYQRQLGQMDKAAQIETDRAQLQQDFSKETLALTEDINSRNLAMSTTANTQGEYLSAIETITKEAMVSINEIETTEGITAEEKTKMIANTVARRDADLAFMKSLYSNMPTWDFSWVDIETMPTAPGV